MFGLSIKNNEKDFNKYRWFFTSKGNLVVGGKSDEQNELVLKHFLKPEFIVVHTTFPGSPFMIIQHDNPSENEIEETAIFCACFSKQWKNIKNEKEKISIDIFKGKQIYKTKLMKKGTFGVKGSKETTYVLPRLVLIFQKGKLHSIPKTKNINKKSIGLKPEVFFKPQIWKNRPKGRGIEPNLSNKNIEILAEIKPGKLNKTEAVNEIFKKIKNKYSFPITKEEIMQVIPSDKMYVR